MTLLEFYEQTKKGVDEVIERYGDLCYLSLTHVLDSLSIEVFTKSKDTEGVIHCNTDNAHLIIELRDQFSQISDSRKANEE